MKTCKFCGITEETQHINRDNMCARCYRITEKAKHDLLTPSEKAWFEDMCRLNFEHGMFVPIAVRRRLRAEAPWRCKKCGTAAVADKDPYYVNYCVECATEIRKSRKMPAVKKTRSDKGGTHASPLKQDYGVTRPDARLGRRNV